MLCSLLIRIAIHLYLVSETRRAKVFEEVQNCCPRIFICLSILTMSCLGERHADGVSASYCHDSESCGTGGRRTLCMKHVMRELILGINNIQRLDKPRRTLANQVRRRSRLILATTI